jgi:hypothetical protein
LIFDEGHFDMAHMMDWIVSPWGILILGVIGLLLIVIIIFVILQRRSTPGSDTVEIVNVHTTNDVAIDITKEESKYCSECGNQIDNRDIDYCPLCGTKV